MTPQNGSPSPDSDSSAGAKLETGPHRRRRRRRRGRSGRHPARTSEQDARTAADEAADTIRAIHEAATDAGTTDAGTTDAGTTDPADHQSRELQAQSLPAPGVDIVHWRPPVQREFRYLMRECFD